MGQPDTRMADTRMADTRMADTDDIADPGIADPGIADPEIADPEIAHPLRLSLVGQPPPARIPPTRITDPTAAEFSPLVSAIDAGRRPEPAEAEQSFLRTLRAELAAAAEQAAPPSATAPSRPAATRGDGDSRSVTPAGSSLGCFSRGLEAGSTAGGQQTSEAPIPPDKQLLSAFWQSLASGTSQEEAHRRVQRDA